MRPGRRLLYALLPLALLAAALELGLRLAGWQGNPDREVSWNPGQALLAPPFFRPTPLPDGSLALVAAFEGQPHPMARAKPPHTRRIYTFGGSAVHGYGFTRNGAWPDRLEGHLAGAWPEHDVEVINAGAVAWSSQQILMLVKDVVAHGEPDLLVVAAGNNELLEWFDARQYLEEAELRRWVAANTWAVRLRRLRTYRLLLTAVTGVQPGGWGRLELAPSESVPMARRARMTDADRAWAAGAFRHNLQRVLEVAGAAGVPVVLGTVPVNHELEPGDLALPPPPGIARRPEDLDNRLADAGAALTADPATAAPLEALFQAWPEAATAWRIGMAMQAAATHDPAWLDRAATWLERAVTLDEIPNRARPQVNEVTRELAPRAAAFVDGDDLLNGVARRRGAALSGSEEVYDHCHPSWRGHALLAEAYAQAIATHLWPGTPQVAPPADAQHFDGWLAVGAVTADPTTPAPDAWAPSPDPGTDRKAWRALAHAHPMPGDAADWNTRANVAWHTHHADCAPYGAEPERAPCLEEAWTALVAAIDRDPAWCVPRASLARLAFAVDHPATPALLDDALACDPADARTAWYRRRQEVRRPGSVP